MNLVNRFTRAGVNGKQIVCPHCNNNARVFHFAWCALTCQVCSFYNTEDGLYPIAGCTKERLFAAYGQYRKTLISAAKINHPRYTWGGGDSVDRERVRDMMLSMFPNTVQYVYKPYRTLINY